ncbi:MAG TPA: UDP-N-acetylmuramoyl-L-alanyl-D-glutamate--2,6-diaminopimelate ligase, partial [Actinobacteria bacterium]|nr:UDP-N-acetylmuramoyl-L-alanyl-D-glutamate--2,6-diaminopimelate ligase [Actinomycetota bacterium]
MKISDLAVIIDSLERPDGDIDVSDLAYDSRQAKPGSVFFAVPGIQVDGYQFIDQAVENGAIAVVVERLRDDLASSIIQLKVEDSRRALAQASDKFF